MTSLHTEHLSIEIGGKSICKDLNLNIEAGQIWGILGRNGVGKTTLLHTLAGLREASSGEIFINNTHINLLSRKHIAQQLGLLLQHTEDPFPTTVMETVLSGRHPHIDHWQWENKQDIAIAQQALQTVDMQSMQHRLVNQLSGGERQRVAIATLLTQQPEILLLDEPNTHLDLNYQIKLLNIITTQARQQQNIILMSLHDINLANHYCDHILLINNETDILAGKTCGILSEKNLEKAYDCTIKKVSDGDTTIFTPSL
jgi:iron complex transport system ATP-binding protein